MPTCRAAGWSASFASTSAVRPRRRSGGCSCTKGIAQLLLETDFPWKRDPELTGFEHMGYMCVLFKRLSGTSPGPIARMQDKSLVGAEVGHVAPMKPFPFTPMHVLRLASLAGILLACAGASTPIEFRSSLVGRDPGRIPGGALGGGRYAGRAAALTLPPTTPTPAFPPCTPGPRTAPIAWPACLETTLGVHSTNVVGLVARRE